jgi:hypothetical protein
MDLFQLFVSKCPSDVVDKVLFELYEQCVEYGDERIKQKTSEQFFSHFRRGIYRPKLKKYCKLYKSLIPYQKSIPSVSLDDAELMIDCDPSLVLNIRFGGSWDIENMLKLLSNVKKKQMIEPMTMDFFHILTFRDGLNTICEQSEMVSAIKTKCIPSIKKNGSLKATCDTFCFNGRLIVGEIKGPISHIFPCITSIEVKYIHNYDSLKYIDVDITRLCIRGMNDSIGYDIFKAEEIRAMSKLPYTIVFPHKYYQKYFGAPIWYYDEYGRETKNSEPKI